MTGMSTAPAQPVTRGGRGLLWLGILAAFAGPILYAVQLTVAGRMDVPWYAPALATLGVILVLLSLATRVTIWRGLGLLIVAFLGGVQWHFLLNYTRLPSYNGPVVAGQSFPEFTAKRADGTTFTRADLAGEKATALVFFRGHW
jgi:hypothetical protein